VGDPPKKKRHHYVPQFVLRNFSSDGGTVPTFALESNKVYDNAPIKGQCAEDYFYGREPHMENAFADSESKVSGILRAAAVGDVAPFLGDYRSDTFPESAYWQSLRLHPLYVVRDFVHYQAHRTAAVSESFESNLDSEVKWWLRKDPKLRDEHPDVLERLDDVTISSANPMGHILYSAGPFSFGMMDLAVKFLVLDEPGFVLSDHPVSKRNQFAEQRTGDGPGALGTFARGLQMFMPVSPTMTIALYDPGAYECGDEKTPFVKVSSRNARILNMMQARNANECIYVYSKSYVDMDELHREWRQRPTTVPRREEGPMRPQRDGTLTQHVYLLEAERAPLPRLRCFSRLPHIRDDVRLVVGANTSFPMRSRSLIEGVEGLAAAMDWKVKEHVIAEKRPVHPGWRRWIDSIEDPRRPRRRNRR
jgi:hypothetical protein